MKIWLITVGEPLPTDAGENRLLRTGLLADALVEKGHEVTWWTSTFDHTRRQHRFACDTELHPRVNLEIRLLHGTGYKKNVSLGRLVDHVIIAYKFLRFCPATLKPDIILCSMPTVELSVATVWHGKKMRIPVILDVRDLWPDIFVELAPPRLRAIAKMVLFPMFWAVRTACNGATAIIGNSPGFVEWGLRYAGRLRNRWDRDFPFGYSQRPPDEAAVMRARLFWEKFGLTEKCDDCFVACFFGTIGRQFDLGTIIVAAHKLAESGRKFKFVLCGDGGALDDYKRLAAACDNIIFPGWVGASEIWALMQISHVGLAPYENGEGFKNNLPNKPIEYLSAGLPVVSSLQGYLEDMLTTNDCGLTYHSGSAESLADAMIFFYENPSKLRLMSQNAFTLYKKKFVAETIYEELIDYLEQVIRGRRAFEGEE